MTLALFTHDRGLLILVLFRDIRGLCDDGHGGNQGYKN